MPRILVLYHSTYGHIEAMAEAVAEGARSVEGAMVDIKRVPELAPEELARASGYGAGSRRPAGVPISGKPGAWWIATRSG